MFRFPQVFVALRWSLLFWMVGSCQVLPAQGPRNQPRIPLLTLDIDHDGQLSSAEIEAARTSLSQLDRNRDGRLTEDEYQPPPEANGASADELVQQLMTFDRNNDAVLQRTELPPRMQNLFDRADTNHDRKLTGDEIRATANRQSKPLGNPSLPLEHGIPTANDPLLFAIDTNHDGTISAAELAAAGTTLPALDKNHDGVITAEEMTTQLQTPDDRTNRMLAEYDTNHDTRIARNEVPDRMLTQFDRIDGDHDGSLTREEMIVYYSDPANTAPRQGGAPNRTGNQEGKQ